MAKVDQAISVMEYLIKKRKRRLEATERRVQLTEQDKIFIGEETEFLRSVQTLMEAWREKHDNTLGKLPPQATDLEESVLGAMILERDTVSRVVSFLKPSHFYLERHQIIYSCVLKIHEQNVQPDMRIVVGELRRTGHLELVGGAHCIAELTAKVSSAANIEYHSRILVEFAIKRDLILQSAQILNDCYDDTQDAFEILDRAELAWKTTNEQIKK